MTKTKEKGISDNTIDFMSLEKYEELRYGKALVHSTFNINSLLKIVKSMKDLGAEEVEVYLSKDIPLMIKSNRSDSGLCAAPVVSK